MRNHGEDPTVGNPIPGLLLASAKEAEGLAEKIEGVLHRYQKDREVILLHRDVLNRTVFVLNANAQLLRQMSTGVIQEEASE